jgi:hypothetical protein
VTDAHVAAVTRSSPAAAPAAVLADARADS